MHIMDFILFCFSSLAVACPGYVTEGAAFLRKIKQGDIIKEVKARIIVAPPVQACKHVKRSV